MSRTRTEMCRQMSSHGLGTSVSCRIGWGPDPEPDAPQGYLDAQLHTGHVVAGHGKVRASTSTVLSWVRRGSRGASGRWTVRMAGRLGAPARTPAGGTPGTDRLRSGTAGAACAKLSVGGVTSRPLDVVGDDERASETPTGLDESRRTRQNGAHPRASRLLRLTSKPPSWLPPSVASAIRATPRASQRGRLEHRLRQLDPPQATAEWRQASEPGAKGVLRRKRSERAAICWRRDRGRYKG